MNDRHVISGNPEDGFFIDGARIGDGVQIHLRRVVGSLIRWYHGRMAYHHCHWCFEWVNLEPGGESVYCPLSDGDVVKVFGPFPE